MKKRKRKSQSRKLNGSKATKKHQSPTTVVLELPQEPGLVDPRDLKSRPEAPVPESPRGSK